MTQERLNANSIATAGHFLEGELEQRLPQIYEQQYAVLWAEAGMFLPMPGVLDEGTTEVVEEIFEAVGKAAEFGDLSQDIPTVQASIGETAFNVHSFALAYEYSILQLARMAKSGRTDLNMKKARAVDRGLRQRIHDLLVFGSSKRGSTGLFNNALVPVVAPAYNPNTATFQQHVNFFTDQLTSIMIGNQLSAGTDWILTSYAHVQKLKSTYQSNDSGLTAYEAIMKMHGEDGLKGIKGVNEASANLLELYGVTNPGDDLDRMIFMPEDDQVINHLRYAPSFLPPERTKMNFSVTAYIGCSELIISAPNEMRYVNVPTTVI